MNSETSGSPFPTSSSMSNGSGASSVTGSSTSSLGSAGDTNATTVRRVAQKAHEAVDRLEQTVSTSGEKVMGWQQEYGDMAREQVKDNPLAALGVAFGVGIIFAKLFM